MNFPRIIPAITTTFQNFAAAWSRANTVNAVGRLIALSVESASFTSARENLRHVNKAWTAEEKATVFSHPLPSTEKEGRIPAFPYLVDGYGNFNFFQRKELIEGMIAAGCDPFTFSTTTNLRCLIPGGGIVSTATFRHAMTNSLLHDLAQNYKSAERVQDSIVGEHRYDPLELILQKLVERDGATVLAARLQHHRSFELGHNSYLCNGEPVSLGDQVTVMECIPEERCEQFEAFLASQGIQFTEQEWDMPEYGLRVV